MRISDWSSDVCSSDLAEADAARPLCRAGQILHRSDRRLRPGGDHKWPCRSCAARPPPGAGDARHARHHDRAVWWAGGMEAAGAGRSEGRRVGTEGSSEFETRWWLIPIKKKKNK